MAAEKMPLILDNGMNVDLNNVDDLFGDSVGLSLPAVTQSRQLVQRLAQLRTRGSCQTVAWSRSGTIASVTPDGVGLELRFLRCHPDTGIWDVSEPTTSENIKGTPSAPLVHLEWGTTNSPELAVFDALGRVAIVSFAISLNHPFITRNWDNDTIDDINAIAGCYWLPVAPSNQQKPYNVLYGPANKQGNGYQYESSFVNPAGPNHPHSSRSSLFCITMGGVLKMYWSQNNNRLEETIMELESINSSDEIITHAAFASDRKFLFAAVATNSRQLKLLRIEIQWGGPGSSSEKKSMPHNARLNPALVETHVAETDWLSGASSDASNDASLAELSHLQILPAVIDNEGSSTVPATLVTVRSRVSVGGSFGAAQTVIDRWEAVEDKQGLHPAFEQLGARRHSISEELPATTKLRKLEAVTVSKVVVDIQTAQFGRLVILTMADGTVEMRDRFTFEPAYVEQDTNKVMNLRQVGWAMSDNGPCLQAAFSPTFCSMVQIGDDSKLRWCKLHYLSGDIGASNQDPQYAGTIAGLTVTAASAIFYQNNFDDMLAIVQPFKGKKRFVLDWMSEMARILKIQIDYTEETHHDSLMRNGQLQSCLSIMNSLGFDGECRPRSFMGKFAMLALHMRNFVILVTLASNTPLNIREKLMPLDEPEVVDALTGCAKWSLDLLSWVMDCLFDLMNDEGFQQRTAPPKYGELNSFLHERHDVSLHLLLSSSSRSFLSALCRRIAHLGALSNRAIDHFYKRQTAEEGTPPKPMNPQLQQAYQRMQQVTSSSIIKVGEFEKLLNVLGSEVRQAYQAFLPTMAKSHQNPPQGKQLDVAVKTMQIQFEMAMLLASSPSSAFIPVIKKLFTKHLPELRSNTDPAKLFFADFELLGVQDDKASLASRKARGVYMDVFTGREMSRGSSNGRWRRCTRCAAVMEDVFGNRPGFTFVLSQQRKCFCGGYWALLPKDKLIL